MFDTAAADDGDAPVDVGLAEGASGDSGVPPGLAIVFYPVGAGTFEVTAVEVASDGGVFVGGVVRDRYSVSGTIIGSVGGPPHGVVLHANPAGAVDWVRVIAPSGVAASSSPMEVTSFAFTEGSCGRSSASRTKTRPCRV